MRTSSGDINRRGLFASPAGWPSAPLRIVLRTKWPNQSRFGGFMRKTQLQVQSKKQLSKQSRKQRAAADGPPPVMLSAEQVVAQLRALKGQIEEVEPLTPE